MGTLSSLKVPFGINVNLKIGLLEDTISWKRKVNYNTHRQYQELWNELYRLEQQYQTGNVEFFHKYKALKLEV